MSEYTTQPIKELNKEEFNELIKSKEIEISLHALSYLSTGERKVFNTNDLIKVVEKESPRKIYLQANGRYRLYYRKSEGYVEIIISIEEKKAVIISFMSLNEIQRIKLQNEK